MTSLVQEFFCFNSQFIIDSNSVVTASDSYIFDRIPEFTVHLFSTVSLQTTNISAQQNSLLGNSAFVLRNCSVYITNNSNLLFLDNVFRGSGGYGVQQSNVTVSSFSRWLLVGSSITASFLTLGVSVGTVMVEHSSEWSVRNCAMNGGFGSIAFGYSTVASSVLFITPGPTFIHITDSSIFSINSSTLSSVSFEGLHLERLAIEVSMHSSWLVFDSSSTNGIAFVSSTMLVTDFSEFSIESSNVISPASSALSLSILSTVTVSHYSQWLIANATLMGQKGGLAISGSSGVAVDNRSVWAMTNNTLVAIKSGFAMSCSADSIFSVSSASLFLVRGNTRFTPAAAASPVCLMLSSIALKKWGVVRMLENVCSVGTRVDGSGLLQGAISADSSLRVPFFVDRCNTVNGQPVRLSLTIPLVISLECDRCYAVVDCFWGLSQVSIPYEATRCSDLKCACIAGCGGSGRMCAPGIGSTVCSKSQDFLPWPGVLTPSPTVSVSASRPSRQLWR